MFAENCTTSNEDGLQQLQPINGRCVTDLARSSVCTLSQLFSERHCERLISIQKERKKIRNRMLGTAIGPGNYSDIRKELNCKTDIIKSIRSH